MPQWLKLSKKGLGILPRARVGEEEKRLGEGLGLQWLEWLKMLKIRSGVGLLAGSRSPGLGSELVRRPHMTWNSQIEDVAIVSSLRIAFLFRNTSEGLRSPRAVRDLGSRL